MTVTWPKTVAWSLLAVVAVMLAVVVALGFVVYDLRGTVNGQDDARERSECLTSEYKEFFAGTAQTLYALVTDSSPPESAVERLERAARVLPDIDDICA
jgi:hypothetical protein